jgi:hypothetical protein
MDKQFYNLFLRLGGAMGSDPFPRSQIREQEKQARLAWQAFFRIE